MSPHMFFAAAAAVCSILAFAYFGSGTARAEEPAQVCDYRFDETAASLIEQGAEMALVPEAELPELLAALGAATGEFYEGVTRAFIVNTGGSILLGLEIDGCLIPPIILGMPTASGNLSGRVGDKTYA